MEKIFGELTVLGSIVMVFLYILTLIIIGEKAAAKILFISTAVTLVIVYSLKFLFSKDRPVEDTYITPSFPSAHSATAFSAAVVLIQFYPSLRHLVGLLAGAVAVSRVVIDAHYVSDVVAGAVIGLIIGTFVTGYVSKVLIGVTGLMFVAGIVHFLYNRNIEIIEA